MRPRPHAVLVHFPTKMGKKRSLNWAWRSNQIAQDVDHWYSPAFHDLIPTHPQKVPDLHLAKHNAGQFLERKIHFESYSSKSFASYSGVQSLLSISVPGGRFVHAVE
jgi:hypothetical protein